MTLKYKENSCLKNTLASSLPRGWNEPFRLRHRPVRVTIKTLRRSRQSRRKCGGLLESGIVWNLRGVLVLSGSTANKNIQLPSPRFRREQGHIAGKTHIY